MILVDRKNLIIAGLVWGVSLVVFIPAYLFVIKNQEEQLTSLKNEIILLQVDSDQARIATSDSAKENLNKEIENLKMKLGNFVIDANNIQDLASIDIINMARNIGLEEFHIDPWKGVDVAAFNDCKYVFGQTMIVSFSSSFTGFAKFINMLERYKTTIFVDSFSITRSSDEKAKHKINMNLAVLIAKQKTVKVARS
jgi:hypothetical protein